MTNQLEMTLTSLDAPFRLVNRQLLMSNQSREIPSQMFASLFTTVLGRVEGQRAAGKIILQGAWSFGIRQDSP